MAQGVDPEFKSQYHKTKQNTEKILCYPMVDWILLFFHLYNF
jgi:hypothetical protein